jgi:Fic family protein
VTSLYGLCGILIGKALVQALGGPSAKFETPVILRRLASSSCALAKLMGDLERFINDNALYAVDPLIKMALIHHQFESIHPFYDGNGRAGRILNVLYLVHQGLLDIPVLYRSSYIVRTKPTYYRLLQSARDDDAWEDWVHYMLTSVEKTARQAVVMVSP